MTATCILVDSEDEGVLAAAFAAIGTQLLTLRRKKLMAQIDDLNAAIASEGADVTAILAVVSADVVSIATLQTQLAAALANAAPDLKASIAAIQAQTASLAASLPAPATA